MPIVNPACVNVVALAQPIGAAATQDAKICIVGAVIPVPTPFNVIVSITDAATNRYHTS